MTQAEAGRASLIARIEAVAQGDCAVTFVGSAANVGEVERVPYRQLHHDAQGVAAALQVRGITPGRHVALLGPTTRSLVTAIEATWIAGAAAVMLPLPMRLASIDEFVTQTRARILASDAALVVIDDQLADFLDPQPGDPPVVRLAELVTSGRMLGAAAYVRPPDDPDALALLQYTSGSTSDPKGVMLPHRCVSANLDAIVRAADLVPGRDVGVSWLPLYHDMGLIGLLATPLCHGFDLVLGAPQDFLAAPGTWMEWMSTYRGTITAGPNFSYVLAARTLNRLHDLDLSAWRVALNGAEPVDPAAVRAFLDAGERHGLRRGSAFCAFGMAEASLAVTFPLPDHGMDVDIVDRRVLETDHYAAAVASDHAEARELARLGRPLHNLEVRIVERSTGEAMREREVGEIEIRGDSVTPGYYGNPAATEAVFHDGWLRTGDLGYLVDGELVVCGRIKDMIIVGGRNVYPQDVERVVNDVDGVRPGNVIAFGTEGRRGREALVVVAETKESEHDRLREAIKTAVYGAVGLPPEDVVLVAPGTLPKTSSGKLQRALCKTRYLEAAIP
jgi:fatty-acyl-CoA synthase